MMQSHATMQRQMVMCMLLQHRHNCLISSMPASLSAGAVAGLAQLTASCAAVAGGRSRCKPAGRRVGLVRRLHWQAAKSSCWPAAGVFASRQPQQLHGSVAGRHVASLVLRGSQQCVGLQVACLQTSTATALHDMSAACKEHACKDRQAAVCRVAHSVAYHVETRAAACLLTSFLFCITGVFLVRWQVCGAQGAASRQLRACCAAAGAWRFAGFD
jgi:hypothetical protein